MVFVGDPEQYSAVKARSGLLATLSHELPDAVELTEVFRQHDAGDDAGEGGRQNDSRNGLPLWNTIARIVLPTALSGIVTGIMLAVARVMGESAPVLVLVGSSSVINWDAFKGSPDRMSTMKVVVRPSQPPLEYSTR